MRRLVVSMLALLVAEALHAHDFWLEPSTFHPVTGGTVSVGLRVGQDFVGDAVPRATPLIERFAIRQGKSEEEIPGIENTDPAGWFRADARSTSVVMYESRPTAIEMPAAKFEEYLRQQGLENIIAERTRRAERTMPGREIFVRCAKALITGERKSIAAAQPLGLRYEIVPDFDPTAGGVRFTGRVLYERTPVARALVVAVFRDNPSIRLTARTDPHGAFSFALPRPGVWLVKSVQMVGAPPRSGAEWESLWASLTFDWPAERSAQ